MELNNIYKDKIKNSIFHNMESRSIIDSFHIDKKDELIAYIDKTINEWMLDDSQDSLITLSFKGGENYSILNFDRSEIYIKTAANQWEVWKIATSPDYPKMFSVKIKTVGSNLISDDFIMPNEIRSQGYSGEKNQIWNMISN